MAQWDTGNSKARPFLLYGAPTLVYALGIFALSSIPDLSGPELPMVQFDKVAHVFEYGGFAALIMRSVGHYARKMSRGILYFSSLTAVAIFAILDELYQSTIPGRSSDTADMFADTLGGALAIMLVLLWRRRR